MGETYIDWAPRLGYSYSVFNLVFETNVASCRIWDALGFKRIGRVKGAGNLKSHPGQLIDAIIFGRDLGTEDTDLVNEERFDKIKYYLKFGTYPTGADRAEKSRLRSAATHYKLLENDKLMLKDKEVIADPNQQYEIARSVHEAQHGGINKTTATIALKYHWVRIKETVSVVIKNCTECKELAKMSPMKLDGIQLRKPAANQSIGHTSPTNCPPTSANEQAESQASLSPFHYQPRFADPPRDAEVTTQTIDRTLPLPHTENHLFQHIHMPPPHQVVTMPSMSSREQQSFQHHGPTYMPLDPQMMITSEPNIRQHLSGFHQAQNQPHISAHDSGVRPHDVDHDGDSFQAMLSAGPRRDSEEELDMLIDSEEPDLSVQRRDDGLRGSLAGLLNGDDDAEIQRKRQAEEAARLAVEAMRMGGNG